MDFAIYVTPVEGRTVRRFGAPPGTYIGARRVGKQIEWDEGRIVAIPVDEYRRFRAEYDGAIADGSLVKSDAKAYEAQVKARKDARKQAAEDAAKSTGADATPSADAAAEATAEAKRIRAIAETAATIPPPADAERPKPLLLGGKDNR